MTLLSICIPTYNRADLLEYCLNNLRALDSHGLDYEVVVIDHASSDHTPQVVKAAQEKWANIRSFRQSRSVGIQRQVVSGLRMGKGKFTTYIADDDKFIADRLVEYVKLLDGNPKASAVFAPWVAYDDAQEKIIHGYFEVEERKTFTAAKPLELFQFLTSKMAFPEIGVYRTEHLHKVMASCEQGAYMPFLIAYGLLRQGDVIFGKEPFYLEVAVTKPQFSVKSRMNIDINLSHLDHIRASTEIALSRMLMDMGQQQIPAQMRNAMHEVLLTYAHNRLIVAFNRALGRGALIEAGEIAQRVMLWRGQFTPDLMQTSHAVYVPAALQAAAELYNGATWMRHFWVSGFSNSTGIIDALKGRLPEATIEVMEASATPDAPEHTFVLVKTAQQRKSFVKSGILSGNVVALEELAQQFQILPAKRSLEGL